MILSQSVFSPKNITIDSLRLYNRNVSYLDDSELQKICNVRVDQKDIDYLNYLLQKIKPKKIVVYKPSAKSFYGLISNSKNTCFRISKYAIYFPQKKGHYIIDDKNDIEWMDYFFDKYQKMIEFCSLTSPS
jgi:MFS superfamily sulfate permease-like transporter